MPTRVAIDVIRHSAELKKASNTVRIAALALPRLQVHDYGLPGPPFDPTPLLQPGTALLFPEDPDTPTPPLPQRIERLLVLDGTWAQTRRMLRRMPALATLPRLAVEPASRDLPRLRQPHLAEGMATFEALVLALAALEGPDTAEPLLSLYERFVERGRALRGKLSPPPGVTIHRGPPRRSRASQGSSAMPAPTARHDHLLDPDWTFLNHGSFGSTPRELLDLQAELRGEMERQPVRFLARELPERLDAARQRVASFLGADAAGLGFVTNATTGVAAVLQSLDLPPGSEILTTDHRYQAVYNSMGAVAAHRGLRLVEAPVPFPLQDAAQVVQAVQAAITPATRLLVVDWITSPTGLVLPIAELVALGRRHGIPVLVDGAHAPGHVDVDLAALGADFFTGNLHKWLCAPKGCAVLWVAEPWRQRIHHPVPSHGYGQGLHAELDWTGTFDPTPWLCAPAAVERHARLGGPALRQAHHDLLLAARDRLCERVSFLEPQAPDAMLGALCTLPLPWPQHERARVEEAVRSARVEVPIVPWGGRLWVRISAFASYNTLPEYDRLAEVLEAS